MTSFPTKEQLNNLTTEVKLHLAQAHKSDCEYMHSLMVETFTNALKSKSSDNYSHTDINPDKISNWVNMKMPNCKFGPAHEPIENVLAFSGVELRVSNYSSHKPFMTYDKLNKTLTIHPK